MPWWPPSATGPARGRRTVPSWRICWPRPVCDADEVVTRRFLAAMTVAGSPAPGPHRRTGRTGPGVTATGPAGVTMAGDWVGTGRAPRRCRTGQRSARRAPPGAGARVRPRWCGDRPGATERGRVRGPGSGGDRRRAVRAGTTPSGRTGLPHARHRPGCRGRGPERVAPMGRQDPDEVDRPSRLADHGDHTVCPRPPCGRCGGDGSPTSGPWLPEPLVGEAGPAESAELADSLLDLGFPHPVRRAVAHGAGGVPAGRRVRRALHRDRRDRWEVRGGVPPDRQPGPPPGQAADGPGRPRVAAGRWSMRCWWPWPTGTSAG